MANNSYAGLTLAAQADQLSKQTFQAYEKDTVYDTIFDNSPFYGRLFNTNMVEDKNGGSFIQETFSTSTSPNTMWYTPNQQWNYSEDQGYVNGGVSWCYIRDAVQIAGTELISNEASDFAIASMLQTRIDKCKLSIADKIAYAAFVNNPYPGGTNSDGSVGNPAALEGLVCAVDNGVLSANVANVSRASYPSFNAPCNYNANINLNLLTTMETQYAAAWAGNTSTPDMVLSNLPAFVSYWSQLQPTERYYTNVNDLQDQGYHTTTAQTLAFGSAPWFVDKKCPTGVIQPGTTTGSGGFIYILNTSTFKVFIHPERKFALQNWIVDVNGDIFYCNILGAIGMMCIDPRRNSAIWAAGA